MTGHTDLMCFVFCKHRFFIYSEPANSKAYKIKMCSAKTEISLASVQSDLECIVGMKQFCVLSAKIAPIVRLIRQSGYTS